MVEIPNCPRPGQTQYGYVIFDKSVRPLGPVRRVSKVNARKSTGVLNKNYWSSGIVKGATTPGTAGPDPTD